MWTVLDFCHSPLKSQEMPNRILSSVNYGKNRIYIAFEHEEFSNLVLEKLLTLPSQTAILSTDLSADLSSAWKPILQKDLESFDGRVLYIPQKQPDNPVETISISRSSSDDEKLPTPLILYKMPVPEDPADEALQPVSTTPPIFNVSENYESNFAKVGLQINSIVDLPSQARQFILPVACASEFSMENRPESGPPAWSSDQNERPSEFKSQVFNLPGHEIQSTHRESFLPFSDKILGDKSDAQWVQSTQVNIPPRANQDLNAVSTSLGELDAPRPIDDGRAVLQMPVIINTQSEIKRTSDPQVAPQDLKWPVPISADSGSEIIVPSQSVDNKSNSAQQTYQMPVPVPQGEAGNHALETISQNLEVLYNPTSEGINRPILNSEKTSGGTSEPLIVQSISVSSVFHTQDYSHNGWPQNASESIKGVAPYSEDLPFPLIQVHPGVLFNPDSYPLLPYPVAKDAESDHRNIDIKSHPSANDFGSFPEFPKASLFSRFAMSFNCFRPKQNLQSTETSATSEPSTRFSFLNCFAFACARSPRANS